MANVCYSSILGVISNKASLNDYLARFNSRYLVDDQGCWIWIAGVDGHGYGDFCQNGKHIKGYTFAYLNFRGPIPNGLELDHLCRNIKCVNPWHLEAVTHRENMIRGDTVIARNIKRAKEKALNVAGNSSLASESSPD